MAAGGIAVPDQIDIVTEMEPARIKAALARHHAHVAAQDAVALSHPHTPGVCIDCDGDIDHRRLSALPHAVRCVECQEITEIGRA